MRGILKLERPLVFFDLETTGLEVASDRIVEVGLVRLTPDGDRERLVERIDPGIDIPESSAKIHGIRTEDVRGLFGRPSLSKFADKLCAFFDNADLAGFNCIAYDLPLWLAECKRHSIDFDPTGRHVLDAKLIFNSKEASWDRFLMGPRNLTAAVRHYCGRELTGAHAADVDADATVDVLLAQLKRHPDLPRDVPGLAKFCEQVLQQVMPDARSV